MSLISNGCVYSFLFITAPGSSRAAPGAGVLAVSGGREQQALWRGAGPVAGTGPLPRDEGDCASTSALRRLCREQYLAS